MKFRELRTDEIDVRVCPASVQRRPLLGKKE